MPVKSFKRKTRKPGTTSSLSINELEHVKQVSKKKHGTAANTTASYNGYIQRGKQWLADLTNGVANQGAFDCPHGSFESGGVTIWKWTTLDLIHAFDLTPTRASPWAVASFITFKCFEENLGASTADGIQAAFKKFWDNSDMEGIYRGVWKWDEEKVKGTGNPACSVDVMDTVHAVKKKHGSESQRSHSSAMSLNFLQRIYNWSLKFLPAAPTLPNLLSLTSEERLLIHKHLGWHAFSSFGWTLWTRNFETLQLRHHHLIFNCVTNDEFRTPHWKVSLEQRKNWQNKLGKDQELRGHLYEIYPQPELAAADLDFHMRNWLLYLEHAYGRTLLPTDFIFPSIGCNGIIQQQTSMSHDTIQRWLDEFVRGAEIDPSDARLTTHCFRRGGAQYRFMYAPVGKRWTLATIRWWGGWAEGEHRDTLIRYLLDELHYYEEGHGDALRPIKTENHISFLGEHRDQQLVTHADMKAFLTSIQATMTTKVVEDVTSIISNALRDDSRLSAILDILHSKLDVENPAAISSTIRKGDHNPYSTRSSHNTTGTAPDDLLTKFPLATHNSLPTGLNIPNIDPNVPSANRWKVFIQHWNYADPAIGHYCPLKDWQPDWIRYPTFAMKYSDRKLVALEFDRCGQDDIAFVERWPEAERGTTPLVKAIRQARIASGESKPRQRKKVKNASK